MSRSFSSEHNKRIRGRKLKKDKNQRSWIESSIILFNRQLLVCEKIAILNCKDACNNLEVLKNP